MAMKTVLKLVRSKIRVLKIESKSELAHTGVLAATLPHYTYSIGS